jgi:hypothetical protein
VTLSKGQTASNIRAAWPPDKPAPLSGAAVPIRSLGRLFAVEVRWRGNRVESRIQNPLAWLKEASLNESLHNSGDITYPIEQNNPSVPLQR